MISPPLFDILFAAVLTGVLQRIREDVVILAELEHLKELSTSSKGPEQAMGHFHRVAWKMLNADNACTVS